MGGKAKGAVRIGVGGWTYEPWRGTFYPAGLTQKRELEYASRHLTSIEINGTFYGAQKPETFAKWRDETPDGFVFSLKAPRFAAQRAVLADAGRTIARFFAGGVMELKDKLGPINWQLMPTQEFDPADFEAFLKLLPKEAAGHALRHAVEVRHASFRCAEFVALMRKHGMAAVIAGDSAYPQIADLTAPFVYARIMGTRKKISAIPLRRSIPGPLAPGPGPRVRRWMASTASRLSEPTVRAATSTSMSSAATRCAIPPRQCPC